MKRCDMCWHINFAVCMCVCVYMYIHVYKYTHLYMRALLKRKENGFSKIMFVSLEQAFRYKL